MENKKVENIISNILNVVIGGGIIVLMLMYKPDVNKPYAEDISTIKFFIIMLIAFLIMRELIMWYWKINKIVTNQQLILKELITGNELKRKVLEKMKKE